MLAPLRLDSIVVSLKHDDFSFEMPHFQTARKANSAHQVLGPGLVVHEALMSPLPAHFKGSFVILSCKWFRLGQNGRSKFSDESPSYSLSCVRFLSEAYFLSFWGTEEFAGPRPGGVWLDLAACPNLSIFSLTFGGWKSPWPPGC